MTNPNSYLPKTETQMLSFTMPCENNARNLAMTKQACAMRVEDLNNQAAAHNKQLDEEYKNNRSRRTETRHHCNMSYEVVSGLNNIRVNLYGASAKDAMMIGYNFCALQMNPTWKEAANG